MVSLAEHFADGWPKLVMYDLDGTLVDSVPDLAAAVDCMLLELSFKPAGMESVRSWVGNGGPMLVRRALAAALSVGEEKVPTEILEAGLAGFYSAYQEISGSRSVLYPGVEEFLVRVADRQATQVIITNKPAQFVPSLLEELGIAHYFDSWLGGDSLPQKKPDPEPLLYMLNKFSVEPESALMVGDSVNDIAAARTAGVRSLAVGYGYNHGRPVEEENPDWLVHNLSYVK